MSKQEDMNEKAAKKALKFIEKEASRYYKEYPEQMEVLESDSVLGKTRSIQPFDYYALGKQLEQFDVYKEMCEEAGNVNLLGKIPNVAYDVITAVYSASIIPVISSVQPIGEERGTVYFKNVRSSDTRGSQTAGDVVVDPKSGVVTPSNYAGNKTVGEVGDTTAGSTVDYSFTLVNKPIRSETLKVTVEDDPSTYALDVGVAEGDPSGEGRVLGVGLSGSVNYTTGVVTLKFAVQPTVSKKIYVEYQQNFEKSTDIPQINTVMDSKGIMAHVYALKGTTGMLQSFGLKKRFGMIAEDELARDLIQEINREIGGDLIRKLDAAKVGSTSFDKTPPSTHISLNDHYRSYKIKLAESEEVLIGNAGRGTITHLIVGREHASIIQTLPGFTKLTDGSGLGAHVFGTLDGITVVRVPEAALLDRKAGMALWKGLSPFEAPAVYSPFMPLTVTGTLPEAPNPLVNMRAAAVWAGIESLVPNFVTEFKIIESSP